MFRFSAGTARHNLYKCHLNYFSLHQLKTWAVLPDVASCKVSTCVTLLLLLLLSGFPSIIQADDFCREYSSLFFAFLSALEWHLAASIPSACSKDDMGIHFQGDIAIPTGIHSNTSEFSNFSVAAWCYPAQGVTTQFCLLHMWIPSMLTGISQRDEGLV